MITSQRRMNLVMNSLAYVVIGTIVLFTLAPLVWTFLT